MSKITCVGCGMMGSNLISAFMDKGHEVTIVDINDRAAQPYIARGAHYVKNLADALDTKFIVFSVPDDNVVRKILSGCPEGSLKDKILVNTSSEVPSDVLDVERIVKAAGDHYIDSTILTYQGEVGTQYGYLLYSGEEKAYRIIEEDLYALSNPPIFLGENTSVAAEIVDLVVITAHFGFPYSPLEGIARCLQNGYDIDKYLDQMVDMLPILAHAAREQASQLHLETVDDTDVDTVCNRMTQAMKDAGVSQRLNADWLKATNRSVANHYLKMLHIKETNYEY